MTNGLSSVGTQVAPSQGELVHGAAGFGVLAGDPDAMTGSFVAMARIEGCPHDDRGNNARHFRWLRLPQASDFAIGTAFIV